MSLTRQQKLDQLTRGNADFDVVIIGGGITGAGIAREAAGSGLSTLLVEQRDFAWGTSSRSSKMVHGGLRYLGSGHFSLTRDAVRERERLLSEAPGLIDPLRFVMPHYRKQFPGPRLFQLLLRLYDRMAGHPSRQRLSPAETLQRVPGLSTDDMVGASGFTDAVTDDARLVQRVLEEAEADGAVCLNYLSAEAVLRDSETDAVTGVKLRDTTTDAGGPELTVNSPLVINATGAWASQLQQPEESGARIRPLRGSHLVVPFARLPVSCSVSLFHPRDHRPVFAFPWQGTTVLGTTDLDHTDTLSREPVITREELNYLLQISTTLFPASDISERDVIATWAGVRPVVTEPTKSGKSRKPSQENREHVIWSDNGLISVAGGKLTTFRLIAREVLEKAQIPGLKLRDNRSAVFSRPPERERPDVISHRNWHRLQGFYGPSLDEVLDAANHTTIADTETLWAELAWTTANTGVVHLDDLMLRRTRLGLILPHGGEQLLPEIRQLCQPLLGWDDATWDQEVSRYLDIWRSCYSLPAGTGTQQ